MCTIWVMFTFQPSPPPTVAAKHPQLLYLLYNYRHPYKASHNFLLCMARMLLQHSPMLPIRTHNAHTSHALRRLKDCIRHLTCTIIPIQMKSSTHTASVSMIVVVTIISTDKIFDVKDVWQAMLYKHGKWILQRHPSLKLHRWCTIYYLPLHPRTTPMKTWIRFWWNMHTNSSPPCPRHVQTLRS